MADTQLSNLRLFQVLSATGKVLTAYYSSSKDLNYPFKKFLSFP